MFRIYYHLYTGSSWRQVWSLHRPYLERFAASGLLERLVVCVCGGDAADPEIHVGGTLEVRHLSGTRRNVNEFHTLQQMHRDATEPRERFEHCVYLHTKGSSSKQLSAAGAEWSEFLAKALISSLPGFDGITGLGFNSLGSNLALGLFEDFGEPRLHYSGNFWCATRQLVASAPQIELGVRYTTVRHNAEWWLDRTGSFTPFNVFSTGINHYSATAGVVDWSRLESRMGEFSSAGVSAERAMQAITFLRQMIRGATGNQPLRYFLSETLLRVLPHHRWRRLLNAHHLLMKALGSHKSVYFYCPESR